MAEKIEFKNKQKCQKSLKSEKLHTHKNFHFYSMPRQQTTSCFSKKNELKIERYYSPIIKSATFSLQQQYAVLLYLLFPNAQQKVVDTH